MHGYLNYSVKGCCVLTERVLYTHWKGIVVIFSTFQSRFAIIIVVCCAMLNNKLQLIPLTQIYLYLFWLNNISNKWFLPVILANNYEMKCVYPKFTTCYRVTWNKMVKLPCYLILCQCYLDTYNWCLVTLLPEMFFHCYLVTCPKYPMLPCYLKTVNRPHWTDRPDVLTPGVFLRHYFVCYRCDTDTFMKKMTISF